MWRLWVWVPLLMVGTAAGAITDPLTGSWAAADEESWLLGGNLLHQEDIFREVPPAGFRDLAGGIALSGGYDDYHRRGGLEGEGSSFRRGLAGAAYMQGAKPIGWLIEARHDEDFMRADLLRTTTIQEFQFLEYRPRTVFKGQTRYRQMAGAVKVGTAPGVKADLHLVAGLHFNRWGALNAGWKREYHQPRLEARWRGEEVSIQADAHRESATIWMRSPEIGRFSGALRLHRTSWVRRHRNESEPVLEPWGSGQGFQGLILTQAGDWIAGLGVRGLWTRLKAYGMDGSYPYAKVTDGRVDFLGTFFSAQLHPTARRGGLTAEVERLEWRGRARGHIEFWPFTSGLVDLLGLRRYFLAETQGYLWRIHAGCSRGLGVKGQWSGAVNLMDIHPSGWIEHWKPTYLVFGRDDVQLHSLMTYRLLAGTVHLSVGWTFSSVIISYSVAQVVLLKTWRHATPVVPAPPEEVSPVGRAYGGGFHLFKVEYMFERKK